eukprot:1161519-Pelagomonas_calceolata.AAC.3
MPVGMKFASNFNGTLVVKLQLFELVQGMLNMTCPTNAQQNVHMSLVCIHLVRLSHAVSYAGPLSGAMAAA